jgi:hypothetical protein
MEKVNTTAVAYPHIKEAERYLDNAKEILSEKAGKQDGYYSDKKYVKMAGNTAWNGVLVALDETLHISKSLKKNQRADIKDFQMAVAKIDKKMSKTLDIAYDTLHKAMGYDGNLSAKVVQSGIQEATTILNWCQSHSK